MDDLGEGSDDHDEDEVRGRRTIHEPEPEPRLLRLANRKIGF